MDLEIPSDVNSVEDHKFSSSSNEEDKDRRGKDVLEEPRVLASAEPGPTRKRGRPAATGTKKGKAGVNRAQRRRTTIRKKPAKISGIVDESGGSDDDSTFREEHKIVGQDYGMTGKEGLAIQETEMVNDYELSQKGKAAKRECVEDVSHEERFDKVPEVETADKLNSEDSTKPEKREIMTDPVEAMLLDMIPSLGMKKIEAANATVEDEKTPPQDLIVVPEKKKKVSYKDVAGELLKDW